MIDLCYLQLRRDLSVLDRSTCPNVIPRSHMGHMFRNISASRLQVEGLNYLFLSPSLVDTYFPKGSVVMNFAMRSLRSQVTRCYKVPIPQLVPGISDMN